MLDAYQDLIDELLGTPTEIRGQIDVERSLPVPDDAKRLLAELRDRDRAVLERVQTITRQETPYLRAFRADSAGPEQDLDILLDQMEQARGDLVSILINLSLKDWAKPAIDETEGEITLADEVERHVEFDEAHRQRFRELMAEST
jgi:hypothetical protein